jgi:hypothetical protein
MQQEHVAVWMSFPSPKIPSPREFYERYKNDPEAAMRTAFKIGQERGEEIARSLGIQGNDLETLAAVLNEYQRSVQGDPSAKVEGNRVTMRCWTGFCPIMRAALTLGIPWVWLDTNVALPMIRGIASYVIPTIEFKVPSTKSRGDPACIFIFEE